jgi:hypothetical protein
LVNLIFKLWVSFGFLALIILIITMFGAIANLANASTPNIIVATESIFKVPTYKAVADSTNGSLDQGMGNGVPTDEGNYTDFTNSNPYQNATSTASSKVVYLANDPVNLQKEAQKAAPTSPLIIAGLGIGFIALVPVSWKILKYYKN